MFRFISTLYLSLILSFVFSACSTLNQQKPTPASAYEGMRKTVFDDGSFLNYESDVGNLEAREGKLSDGYYEGKKMLPNVFDPIFFNFDSMAIDSSQRTKMAKVAEYLDENLEFDILIKGRCDWYGTEEYNLALGDLRANSVALYLEDLGVSKERINTVSLGSLESNIGLSKSAASKDRRADLILLK